MSFNIKIRAISSYSDNTVGDCLLPSKLQITMCYGTRNISAVICDK